MDCGPSCLRMIARWYGKEYSLKYLREHSFLTRLGVSILGISDAAESVGFRSGSYKMTFDQLLDAPLPFIAHWNQNHFIVIYKIKEAGTGIKIYVADPSEGLLIYRKKDFEKFWYSTENEGISKGHILILEPTP